MVCLKLEISGCLVENTSSKWLVLQNSTSSTRKCTLRCPERFHNCLIFYDGFWAKYGFVFILTVLHASKKIIFLKTQNDQITTRLTHVLTGARKKKIRYSTVWGRVVR